MAEFYEQDQFSFSVADESIQHFNMLQMPLRNQSIRQAEYDTSEQQEYSSQYDENDPTQLLDQPIDVKPTLPIPTVGQKKKKISNKNNILPSSPTQIQQKTIKKEKDIYMLPGESKNIPKNLIRAFKEFIYQTFESAKRTSTMNKILALKPEKACKQTLLNMLKDVKMKQLAQQFFGQQRWASIFLIENKVELEQYFRFNKLYFQRKNQEEAIEE